MVLNFFVVFLVAFAVASSAGAAGQQPIDMEHADLTPQVEEIATEAPQEAAKDEKTALVHPRRAELEGKLKVEKVLLKGTGDKGVEIEVSYRIVDVEGYAGHPKATFVADEASGKLVPLTILAKLFTPLPAEEAEKVPPATLTLWDKEGAIKPGQPVTVVVAGYGQKHLIPEAGPEYDPKAVAVAKVSAPNPLAVPDAQLVVQEVKVVGNGYLLDVRFSSKGIKALDPADDQTYVENPETGERYPVAKVPRIGLLAPQHLENLRSSYMIIDNARQRIKPGDRVHVVVSGVRQENVPVVGEHEQ
jgi:hypothetical protein